MATHGDNRFPDKRPTFSFLKLSNFQPFIDGAHLFQSERSVRYILSRCKMMSENITAASRAVFVPQATAEYHHPRIVGEGGYRS